MAIQAATCQLCQQPARQDGIHFTNSELEYVMCPLCGDYYITENDQTIYLPQKPREEPAKVASILNERRLSRRGVKKLAYFVWLSDNEPPKDRYLFLPWRAMLDEYPEKLSERLDRGLVNLGRMSNKPGELFIHSPQLHFSLFTDDPEVADFMLNQLVLSGLVEKAKKDSRDAFRISAKGWERVADLERGKSNKKSKSAFLACNLSNGNISKVVIGAFKTACEGTGFEPRVSTEIEHNDKIDDRIIIEINNARFVVCDMTGQRQNVYYEAGYAQGIKSTVIWTCREDDVEKLHFDVRQYSNVVWKAEADLAEKLTNRIRATIR